MATKRHLIRAQDLYRIELIDEVRLTPGGNRAFFVKKRVDKKTEKKYSNLWEVGTGGGSPRQFTQGDQNDFMPRISPRGGELAFLSNRADRDRPPQIHLISTHGGEARRLCQIDGEISGMEWSPDGKSLLCSVRKLDPEELERQRDEKKKKLGVVSRKYDRLFYKLDGYGYLPHERTHLWRVDARTGKAVQLTDHAVFDEVQPSWSPDGQWIVFVSNRSADPDVTFDRQDVYVIPSGGGKLRQVTTLVGEKRLPVVSPDGKWIAFFGHEGEGNDWKNSRLYIVPFDGSAAPRDLTGKHDIHAHAWTINDLVNPECMPPAWSCDSRTIYFQVVRHGATVLMSVEISGRNLKPVIEKQGVVGSFSLDRQRTRVAYFFGSMTDPNQVRLLDLSSGADRALTHFNQGLLGKADLGSVREVWYKGPDDNDLQGWIMTPPGFNSKKKYPAILEIHGGPLTQYGFYFMHEFYYLASQGYVVFFTNPRGGRGYGEKHARAIYGDWGRKDYADLMAWVDRIEKEPYVDPTRLGVTGGSYGGYMTLWIVGHTQRFRAAVTMRCVSNFVSEWGSSDVNWSFELELRGKPPFADLAYYWDHSPIKYIGNVKTPTKVIHNENDQRCPIEQGEQVFVALKRLGVDTQFVRFPEEFHGLSRGGRTDRRVARLNAILEWFDKYLK